MNKHLTTFFLIALFISNLSGQQSNYLIQRNSFEEIKISFPIPSPVIDEIDFQGQTFSTIHLEGYIKSSDVGNPQLPLLGKLIEIPLCDDININIIPGEYDIYNADDLGIIHDLFPSQPSYAKSFDGTIELVKNEETYNTDAFYGSPLAWVEKVGVLRCMNLGNVFVSPVEYNPVTRQVKIYRNINVIVSYVNADIPATYQMKNLHNNGLFSGLESQVINPMTTQSKDVLTTVPIKYLIVAGSTFDTGQLDGFVEWKKRKGFLVEIVYTGQSGVGTTTTSIQSFIKSKYDNATPEDPAPTYVLLVGDVQQLPTFTVSANGSSHVSDLNYFTWTTGDNIPDCYYGRFSAQNATQLATILEKTLMYEQYTMPDPSYLGDAVLVAGTDSYWSPTHANGQMNYLSGNYINTSYGYNTVHHFPYPASSQASTIRARLGEGVGYANYTAHCGSSGWSDPTFETSHISAMSNANKYGFFIGNCCQSSMFGENQCFGEAIVRTANKGAVSYIGGSDNTYWDEDYYWSVGLRSNINANPTYNSNNLGAYDRLFHTHNEPYSDWFITGGSMIMAGNLSVQSSSSSRKLYYWQIYNILGDPSIMPYLSIPNDFELDVPGVLILGSSNLEIEAVPYAYVALTYENELIAATFADADGNANLQFESLTQPGDYEIAVSAQNYITTFYPINVIVPEGSYLLSSSFTLNNNSLPTVGSLITFDFNVRNVGVANATNVYAKLTSSSSDLTLTTDSIFIGTINTNQQIDKTEAFSCQLSTTYEDFVEAAFVLNIYGDYNSVERYLTINLLAPNIQRQGYIVEELVGNGDGIVDPGEKVKISVLNINTGHMDVYNAFNSLHSFNSAVTIQEAGFSFDMVSNVTTTSLFTAQIADTVVPGTVYGLPYILKKDDFEIIDVVYLTVGKAMEDFESGNFTTYNWQNGPSYPWITDITNKYAGTYCARSSASLTPSNTSTLQITLDVTERSNFSYFRKVTSEEGGDFFIFSVDGVEKEKISGTIPWGFASTTVDPGTHTFKFEYTKNSTVSVSPDCAWIDNVNFPVTGSVAAPDISSGINTYPAEIISLYPNPAQNKVTITCSEPMENIAIIDLGGRVIRTLSASGQEVVEIDILNLSAGFYFIEVEHINNTTSVKKFIKQ